MPNSLDGIVRLIRKICLLREQGRDEEAVRLETSDLASALVRVRGIDGDDLLTSEALANIFEAERSRVADAAALAELIIPQLRKSFADNLSSPAKDQIVATIPAPTTAKPSTGTAPTGSPAIPDLLDAMLAQDRTMRRQRASGH